MPVRHPPSYSFSCAFQHTTSLCFQEKEKSKLTYAALARLRQSSKFDTPLHSAMFRLNLAHHTKQLKQPFNVLLQLQTIDEATIQTLSDSGLQLYAVLNDRIGAQIYFNQLPMLEDNKLILSVETADTLPI